MSDFSIFILSHGRADSVKTYDTLIESGYTGDIRIVVDDLDEQLDDYIDRYGDMVVVFDKRKIAESVDSMINTDELRSVVFARNYAEILAMQMGLKYYAQFDDDVTSLMYKWEDKGKLKSKPILNFDGVVDAITEFMDDSDATTVTLCGTGSLIGGASGVYKNGIGWNFNQTVFVRTGRLSFCGLGNEDINALVRFGGTGELMFEVYRISHTCSERGNNGGLSEFYDDFGLYGKRYMSVIESPSACKLSSEGKVSIIKNNAFPKILGGRFRK